MTGYPRYIVLLLIQVLFCTLFAPITRSQPPTPPCGLDYGSSTDRAAIENAMAFGSEQDVINAINNAKATRGFQVGCPQDTVAYIPPDTTEPTLTDIINIWDSIHVPNLLAYTIDCPVTGRRWATVALGAYYARLAGYFSNLNVLADIGLMMEAQQYSEK